MPGMGDHQGEQEQQGQAEQASVAETARRARDEMQSVTASLRALLKDLRDEAEPPTGARSPGSAPSP
jgi:hypothetical protein